MPSQPAHPRSRRPPRLPHRLDLQQGVQISSLQFDHQGRGQDQDPPHPKGHAPLGSPPDVAISQAQVAAAPTRRSQLATALQARPTANVWADLNKRPTVTSALTAMPVPIWAAFPPPGPTN